MATAATDSDGTPPQPAPPAPAARQRRDVRWWRRPWIAPLALATLVFLAFSVPRYLSLDPRQAAAYGDAPAWSLGWYYPLLVTHIFAGALVMLAVCLQVWPWLRRNHPAVHRWNGRLYAGLGLAAVGIPSVPLAVLSTSGPATAVSTVLWSLLWIACTALGWRAARRRNFAAHRAWMVRSFALIFAIATDRVWIVVYAVTVGPLVDQAGSLGEDGAVMVMAATASWFSWVVNLLIAEWWLQYRRPPRSRPGAERRPAPAAG